MYNWIYLLIGLIIGSLTAYLTTRFYLQNKRVLTKEEKDHLDQILKDMEVENRVQTDRYEALNVEYADTKKALDEERRNTLEYSNKLTASEEDYKNLLEKLNTQKEEIQISLKPYSR